MYLRGKIYFPSASLTSGTTYNIFCGAAPANQRIAIEGFGWYGAANAAQTPGLLSFARATSQGTTGTTITPGAGDQDTAETFQSSWISQPSGAPSGISVLDERMVNPQIGLSEYFPGQLAYVMKGGGFFVMQFTPQWTGNYTGWLLIAE
jgi:hypothetical protein